MSSIEPSAAAETAVGTTSTHLEEVRDRLWGALRVTHEQRSGAAEPDNGEESKLQGGHMVDRMPSDVHTSPTTPAAPLELTRVDMEQLISCVYCAVHINATAQDSQDAATLVLKQLDTDLLEPRASVEAPYTQVDVVTFLNSVPSLWLPDLVAAQEEAAQLSGGSSLLEDFNLELIDCIVNDEEPHNLLEPAEVLTLQRTTAAIELVAPYTDYITLSSMHGYPPVYDTLFAKLRSLDERSAGGLSLSQFRLFFHWFYAMHFRNTNLPRSNAAADDIYQRYLDSHGDLTITQFRLACEEICAVYVQIRDAAPYLQQLVQRTESVRSEGGTPSQDNNACSSAADAEFFLHPEKATLPAWQRDLIEPTQLYLPDELRVVQQEAERHRRHSSPRILLTGPVGIGKSVVGRQLADALHCVHLDVLELAFEVFQRRRQSSVGDVIVACVQEQTPVPLEAQVTLLREAITSERAQYRGYVLSDTITSTTDAIELVEEHFIRPLKILEEARPDHVVELVCAEPEVYAEYATTRTAVGVPACVSACAAVAANVEKRRQAAEKQQMKADCEKILLHLLELESVAPKKGGPSEELQLARQQAVEAQEILDALSAEENEASAEGPTRGDAFESAEEVSSEAKAAQESEEIRLCLCALIYEGRKAACVLAVAPAPAADASADGSGERSPADAIAPLTTQDWTSCWRKTSEAARHLGRYLSVDPIASLDSTHVVSYITHAFNLYPCDLAEVLGVPGEETVDDAAASSAASDAVVEAHATRARPSSLADDEERCRLVEEVVAEKGLRPSPIWKRYCPVTAAVDGVLIEGAACYACAYRGCYYYFASSSKRNDFVDHPTRYLRQAFPEQKAVLLLADDAIIATLPELLQQVADDITVQCRLTPFSASTFATLMEPRHLLLQSRAAAKDTRRKTEAATRKARHERQEIAAKALAKKSKGRLEPTKPKTKKLSDSVARKSPLQPTAPQAHKGSAGGRRRVPRAMVVEGPQSMAEEKQILIDAAKDKMAEGAPLLVTAIAAADLDFTLFHKLWKQQVVPETVVALSFLKTAAADGAAGSTEEAGDEQDGDEADDDDSKNNEGEGRGNDSSTAASSASTFQRIVQLLEKRPKVDWRTAKAEASQGGAAVVAPSYDIHTIPVDDSAIVSEIVAEVMQQLNPLSIVASEDAVDEALGEEGEDGAAEDGDEEDEEQAAEDEALLYPDETQRPSALPRARRDPLVKPMRRFLHQFGSRLDYCPVTLHDRGILVRGSQEFCLHYADGLYIFATEDARNAFARCPQRYVGELPPQDVPPRMWIVGVTQSGKKTLASGLQEAYRVPFFVYDRQFFEECVDTALTPGGGMVRGVYIPEDTTEANPYLKRAFTLLEEVHDKEKEEKKQMEAKAEAERQLEEHERKLEEREAREDAGVEEEEDTSDEDDWTEEKEAALQEKVEFEPEDEEDKQVRLSEAYLRIASCVTRFRPFDKLGYVMICPPFSDGDLDVLFDEGGIPEVVVRLSIDEDVFNQRSTLRAAARRAAAQQAKALDVAAKEREAAQHATQRSREATLLQRAREKALAKWRRRHIGVNDVDEPSDVDNEDEESDANKQKSDGEASSLRKQNKKSKVADEEETEVEAEADRQAQEDALEEFMTFVEERRVEVVNVNAAAARETVRRAVVDALGRHLDNRASLFYHPEVIRPDEVAARLASGQCDWSSFGSQDPVRLYAYRREGQRMVCKWKPSGVRVGPEVDEHGEDAALADHIESADDRQPPEEPEELSEVASDDVEELRDAVQRRDNRARRAAARRVARVNARLYSFDDDTTLARFMRNPWPFLRGPPPSPTLSPAPVVAVFEPDTRCESEVVGAKQRCLADSVAYNLHTKCVSTSSLLAWGAVHTHWQSLRLECMLAAQQGLVDASLTQKLLQLYLSSAETKKDGAVLHNLPITAVSAEALTRVKGTAPVMRVITALPEDSATTALSSSSSSPAGSSPQELAALVAQSMRTYASVGLTLPHPCAPLDSSNLVAAVHGVVGFCADAQEARLRECRAFPVALRNSYEVFQHVQRHLSEYSAYCPYEWVENGDLVKCIPADRSSASVPIDLCLGAKYLGQYFFFSSADYLDRFLRNPTTVTDPATAKPMPKYLPSLVPAAAAAQLKEADLALEGCCPVLLYDTRDRCGMRGVRQPIAKKGSLDFVAEYNGQKYAMLNEEHQKRFLRRPWQYVEGAQLPAVLRRPLPKGMRPSAIPDTEEYLQRQLYDPVAQALVAVGRERPIYPGLSVEESALKYIALYLKAHRDPANLSPFEAASYTTNFELFHKRATLYRHVLSREANGTALERVAAAAATATNGASADDEEANKTFCASYEEVRADAHQMNWLNRLPNPALSP
ncbi:hypothetical protein ABB37_04041 [Leptomonas pyrrhocoris]|uniref:Cilia- and flagella-associated protein 206 n=1 Tax=Leptomonas pyrrhocoris TaxID=157538 RepID=A0A0N0VFS5_LEPPY|nr:hypothetical protein ABB37_04041 [Leptomonas pyrrhocoris]KPA81752.1 hypothetical protein ABB37_04041 [Leptomonas pyrrhocoris]|eukprot:XP_015660191.1 hypothetical protein ABB37_04041 [Leptomonas pyrrhocoris]